MRGAPSPVVSDAVLDASALLAIAKLTAHGLSEEEVREVLAPLSLESVAFDEAQAWHAGALRGATRAQGIELRVLRGR